VYGIYLNEISGLPDAFLPRMSTSLCDTRPLAVS